jgi:phosphoribosylanthranilate isomerase
MTAERVAALYSRGNIVKIDGTREPHHAAAAAAAGADLLGFIFAPSRRPRRQVTPDLAAACIAAARQENPDLLACGVFVNATEEEITETASVAPIDLVQLSGHEPPEFAASLSLPTMKVLHPEPGVSAAEILEAMEVYLTSGVPPAGFVLDAFSAAGAGGTGEKVDWRLAAAVNAGHPTLLAGGLNPENVAEAIALVRPLGVDVSSGVEVDGHKSSERIAQFVAAARAAFVGIATVSHP